LCDIVAEVEEDLEGEVEVEEEAIDKRVRLEDGVVVRRASFFRVVARVEVDRFEDEEEEVAADDEEREEVGDCGGLEEEETPSLLVVPLLLASKK